MRVTLNWLREFVDFDLSAQELADKLDLSGTAIETLTHLGARFENIVVGEVEIVEKHPNADRLNYCEVRLDGEKAGIVCGAPNVKPKQKVAVALPGAVLWGGMKIKSTSIRGVTSEGMICSETELGLGGEASGIMVLPRDTKVGTPLAQALGMDDWVLELEITPNRPDCMGIIGVAREVAALVKETIHIPDVSLNETGKNITDRVRIDVNDPDLCPRYTARFIDNVTIGPSPIWLRQRLEAVGIRAINNVVDITNYVLMETGQPLHAFDFKFLRGGQVTVRRAKAGEKLETIDHIVRTLVPDNLVITDSERPVALAGVMGGLDSEINEETTEVLLESANFSAINIRQTSRSLGLISDSSLRFEKGVDIEGAAYAADRTAQLISEVAGGRIWSGLIDNYPNKREPRHVKLRPEKVATVLGADIGPEKVTEIMKSLELKVATTADTNELRVTVPSFRVDLEREIDLIEEVGRIYGLNNIPSTLLPSTDPQRGLSPRQTLTRKLRSLMVSAGLMEVVNYSFIGRTDLDHLALPKNHPLLKAVPIANPLSEDQGLLRTSLIPSLMRTVAHNYNRGQKDIAIFEIGHVFARNKKLPKETLMLGVTITGNKQVSTWHNSASVPADFYDVKGVLELLHQKLSLQDCHIQPFDHALLQPGKSAEFLAENNVIGFVGALHPQAQANYGLRQPVFVLQISVTGLLDQANDHPTLTDVPKFPSVELDLALVVEDKITWAQVRDLAFEAGAPLLCRVHLFDLYRGPEVPAGKKSMAFSLFYQATDRTLTDNEVAHIQERIVARAKKKLGATLRD